MISRLKKAAVLAGVLGCGLYLPGVASADTSEADGLYLAVSGGWQSRERSTDSGLGTAAEFHDGFGFSGAIGYRFPLNLRPELEFSYLDNENKKFIVDLASNYGVPSQGHVSLKVIMFNLYYDVPMEKLMPSLSKVKPYVGVGWGMYESRINGFTNSVLQAGVPGVFEPTVLDVASEWTSAWQWRIGVGYEVTPKIELFAGYRRFEGDNLQFNDEPPPIGFNVIDVTGAKNDMFELGLHAFF